MVVLQWQAGQAPTGGADATPGSVTLGPDDLDYGPQTWRPYAVPLPVDPDTGGTEWYLAFVSLNGTPSGPARSRAPGTRSPSTTAPRPSRARWPSPSTGPRAARSGTGPTGPRGTAPAATTSPPRCCPPGFAPTAPLDRQSVLAGRRTQLTDPVLWEVLSGARAAGADELSPGDQSERDRVRGRRRDVDRLRSVDPPDDERDISPRGTCRREGGVRTGARRVGAVCRSGSSRRRGRRADGCGDGGGVPLRNECADRDSNPGLGVGNA
jgi:hypothetical protein